MPRTHGLNVSWVARALSGTPFTLVNTNVDPDLNAIQEDPLPAGDYVGSGLDPFTLKHYKAERNGARGPGFFSLDMRFGYGFGMGQRRRLEVSADVFNLTNRTNFLRTRRGIRRRRSSCC